MLIIFGTHLFGLRKYAYKFMNCNKCKTPSTFIQTRGFAWGHIFGIPLIPFGYQYNWYCSSCGKDYKPFQISLLIKLVCLLVILTTFSIISADRSLGNDKLFWQVCVGIFMIWSLYEVVFHFKKQEKNKYKDILPLNNKEFCTVCDGELEISSKHELQCKNAIAMQWIQRK